MKRKESTHNGKSRFQKTVYKCNKPQGFFYRRNGLPRISVKGTARVQYNELVADGGIPNITLRKSLISIGYVENVGDILDVRGCDFQLLLFGVSHIEIIRDWLRFLVVRQRIPHSLMGRKFDWQENPVRDDKEMKLSKIHPLQCFKLW